MLWLLGRPDQLPTLCTLSYPRGRCLTHVDVPSLRPTKSYHKVNQTMTFAGISAKTLAASPLTASATASSGLPVSFTTTTRTVCTSGGSNGATVTLLAAGTCTVQASQAGNSTYNPAPSVSRSFKVST